MTSSNAFAEPALVAEALPKQTPETVDGGSTTRSPFELLPTGEAFGVCDLDGECS